MFNFATLALLAVFVFGIPIKGSILTLCLGALLYVTCATGLGLLMSSILNSQIAAIFGTPLVTLLPAIPFSGLIHPVSALERPGAFLGKLHPTSTYLLKIGRQTLS